ncbi:MAG: DsrE/DsrF/DrsH-like family protein [Candidatus Kariarchaeaceae archaeon]|jgi:peroxiredoxin family protein
MSETTTTKKKKKLAIIASKGGLDEAYPSMILATTAAAMDYDVGIFFTFYGLDIINKRKYKKLKVSAIGNTAAPLPVPSILGMLPGSSRLATSLMKRWMGKANVASLPELIEIAQESGVTFLGCQMTMDVMGVKKDDLLDGIEVCGAAGYLDYASDADVSLFM